MSTGPHSRRFDPCELFPAIGEDGEALFGAPDTSPRSEAEELTGDPAGWDVDEALEQIDLEGCRVDVDEALEQIDLEGCRVCPLCGAIVANDGSVPG